MLPSNCKLPCVHACNFLLNDDGNRCAILLNDAGALFVEATAGVALDSVMPLRPTREVLGLHPSGDELMLIQAMRFACGSLVVGLTAHHTVTDGGGWCSFILAWGQATRGAAVDPVVPVHDRPSFFAPRHPLRVEHEHRGVEFKPYDARNNAFHACKDHSNAGEVVVERVHFSLELKSQASSAGRGRPHSTVQCVVAHLWRCMTRARGLDGGETTGLRIAVDGQARMSPPVPDGYAGNMVLWARPAATARELATRPLRHAAELISRAVARIDDGYFRSFSFIDFASSGAVEEERLVPAADAADLVLSPDVDLGGGWPCFFMPSYLPVEGVVILLPSFFRDGSVDAYVPLFSRDMEAFKNYCCRRQHTSNLADQSGVAKL